jgi:hypothetical protein
MSASSSNADHRGLPIAIAEKPPSALEHSAVSSIGLIQRLPTWAQAFTFLRPWQASNKPKRPRKFDSDPIHQEPEHRRHLDSRKRTSGYLLCGLPPGSGRPYWLLLRLGGLSGFFSFAWDRVLDSIVRAALWIA